MPNNITDKSTLNMQARVLLLGHSPFSSRFVNITDKGGHLALDNERQSLSSGELAIQLHDPLDMLVSLPSQPQPLRIHAEFLSLVGGIIEFVFREPEAATVVALIRHIKSDLTLRQYSEAIHQQVRAISDRFLDVLLLNFKGQVQARLRDISSQAKSNQEQQEALETAEAFRKFTDNIGAQFKTSVLQRIDRANSYRKQKAQANAVDDFESLEMVDKESFEDSLLLNALVKRLGEQLADIIQTLQQAYATWIGEAISDDQLPIGVATLAYEFQDAIAGLNIRTAMRSPVYQVWEEVIEEYLPQWYESLLEMFAGYGIAVASDANQGKANKFEQGILARRARKSQGKVERLGSAEVNTAADDTGNVTPIRPRSANRTGHNVASIVPQGGGPRDAVPRDAVPRDAVPLEQALNFQIPQQQALAAAQTSQLYNTVRAVMQLRNPDAMQTGNMAVDPVVLNTIVSMQNDLSVQQSLADGVSLLQRLQQSLPANAVRMLSPATQGQVELIETMFDAIIDEQVSSQDAKPLLRQLEVPFLKLVLIDDSFLENQQHPARQLLNQLAVMCSFSDVSTNTIKRRLRSVLERINVEFSDGNVQIFGDLLAEVDQLIENQRASHSRNAQRVARTYEGQQTLDEAHQAVKRALSERILGRPVPQIVLSLIDVGWRELLVMSYCKNGPDNQQLADYLKILDDLLKWLGTGDSSRPGKAVAINEEQASRLVETVDAELNAGFPGQYRHRDVVNELRSVLTGGGLEFSVVDMVELDPNSEWYGVSVKEREVQRDIEQPEGLQRWCERAQSLQVGDWLGDIHQNDRKQDLRLAWRSKDGNRFVFVNRQGRKEAEYRLLELAGRMQQGWQPLEQQSEWTPVDRGLYQMLQKVYDELDFRRCHDDLTELLNRKEFENRVAQSVVMARQQGGGHILLQIDLDQFSSVNDYCGMVAGDQLLREISKTLKEMFAHRAVLARTGSNEFGVLLENTDLAYGRKRAEDVRLKIQNYRFEWQNKSYSLTASIGMCIMDEYSADVVSLFKELNNACKLAKEEGRNRVVLASQEDEERRKREDVLAWVARINRALDEDNLTLRCQRIEPISDSGAKPHYEMLLGVRDEKDNEVLVPPDKFIAAAERFNRMQDVDRWVVRHSLKWMKAQGEAINNISGISVNLSGNTLNDDYFLEFLTECFQGTDKLAALVCFEITETATIANLSKAADFINEVKKMGCKFALDDFGTGLSSYEYLKRLPVDYLKIDGCFIKDIVNNPYDYAVVKSINEIGHFMGKQTIAEYVENEDIVALLKEIGVDYAQGFGVEKPRLLQELGSILENT